MNVRQWSRIAGWLSATGGAAWLVKIAVIAAKDGRELDTGAAAWLMRLGLVCLLLGSTGVPLWLTRRRPTAARVAAVLASPIVLAASLVTLGSLATMAVGSRGPAWVRGEAGIVVAGAFWLVVGAALLRQVGRAGAAPSLAAAGR
jgi:hypothetical protein